MGYREIEIIKGSPELKIIKLLCDDLKAVSEKSIMDLHNNFIVHKDLKTNVIGNNVSMFMEDRINMYKSFFSNSIELIELDIVNMNAVSKMKKSDIECLLIDGVSLSLKTTDSQIIQLTSVIDEDKKDSYRDNMDIAIESFKHILDDEYYMKLEEEDKFLIQEKVSRYRYNDIELRLTKQNFPGITLKRDAYIAVREDMPLEVGEDILYPMYCKCPRDVVNNYHIFKILKM